MPQILVSPVTLNYEGNDTDKHIISARPLGASIIGASKLYTSVAHYCMFGLVPRGNYKKEFECYATPSQKGTYEYQLLIGAIASEYTLHADIYKEGLSFLFSRTIDAIKKIWLKPGETEKVTELLANLMREQAASNNSLQTVLANGLIKANDNLAGLHEKLIETLPQMADSTRNHGTLLVAPVGNTCKSITQFAKTTEEIVITEPDAEVIRGGKEMEIDESQKFSCKRITEVNVQNGHCILDIEGFDELVVGKISDPALAMPRNVYTEALNNQTPFTISAKPVKRNGVVQRLYVSDASDGS
jgi:hypothetical protein